jgi:hypothetical protein
MDVSILERVFATIAAIVICVFALIALRGELSKSGLDDNVTKVLLGLMAFGCLLVLLATSGVLPRGGA